MGIDREVTLWPSRENYARFRAVCDDDVPETFDEFERLATDRQAKVEAAHGIKIEHLAFDPDDMARWCRANCGKVDAHARRLYAASIGLSG